MSLLMEALRKAEQVKKQGAAVDRPPEPVAWEIIPDERLLSGTQRSMEQRENRAFNLELAGDETLEIEDRNEEERSVPVSSGTQIEEEGKERTQGPGSPVLDPSSGEAADSAAATGSVGAAPETEVSTPPAHALPPESSGPAVPGLAAPEASVEASRLAARAVFVAKSTHQRRVRQRRLLLGIGAGLALLGAGGFFYFPPRTLANFSLPVGTVKSAVSTDKPASAPTRGDEVEPAGPAASPLADLGKGSVDRNEAVPFKQKPAGEQSATNPVQVGASLAHPAPDSPRTFDAMPPSPIVAATSSLPGSPPGFKSGREVPVSSQQRLDLLPPSEQQGSTQPAIKIVRRSAQPQTDPLLTAAYAAYQQGNFEQSRSQYQQILQADPEHHGAMLGRAALALRSGETDLARSLYLRLLERDPSDPYAKVGLMAVMPKNDPVRLESELKLLLEAHPNVAPLSFFLGNLYAAGQRWNEAQQAYFNALQTAGKSASRQEAVSPDYPFNLAVSLEHLNKPDLAVRYYREALKLAISYPAGFDKEALRRKLEKLKEKETP